MANYLITTMQTTLKAYVVEAPSKEEALEKVERGLVEHFDEELDELHQTRCTKIPEKDN